MRLLQRIKTTLVSADGGGCTGERGGERPQARAERARAGTNGRAVAMTQARCSGWR